MKPKEFLENHDPQIVENGYDNYIYSFQQVIKIMELYEKHLECKKRPYCEACGVYGDKTSLCNFCTCKGH